MRRQFNPYTAAHGILWENSLRHSSFGLGCSRLLHSSGRLILWMIWKNDVLVMRAWQGKGALVSVIINVVLFILWIVFAGILFAASGSY